jgi:hypothetical protein
MKSNFTIFSLLSANLCTFFKKKTENIYLCSLNDDPKFGIVSLAIIVFC